MSSSDIYDVQQNPWAKRPEPPKRRHRRERIKSYDEAVNPDLANTHRRRSRNSGFRRLQHLLKRPEFSRKFWTITVGSMALILGLLILWDMFFRYPRQSSTEPKQQIYRTTID